MERPSRASLLHSLLRLRCLLPFFLASAFLLLFLFSSTPVPRRFLPPTHPHEARVLQVPQIAWGLNNQKIALARALLTARFLNRSLLLPSLSASLTYKDASLIEPLPFDRLFSLPKFNKLCQGFVSIVNPPADFRLKHAELNISKGSGRKWTKERDLQQLLECGEHPHTLLSISGKNPFLWHDHWPLRDYAKIFRCFVLVDSISADVDRIVSKLKHRRFHLFTELRNTLGRPSTQLRTSDPSTGYVAVHMRVEKDWMIHCKKTEERVKMRQGKIFNICSSKQEIIGRVSSVLHLQRPALVYLAVADVLLENKDLLEGWPDGLVPVEKKKLGLLPLYRKYPYLIQSALDYEVCLRADVFVGNSFSTFSSLVALERTMKMRETLMTADVCSGKMFPSYAYNVEDINGGPKLWISNLSDVSLQAISYGTNEISCDVLS